MTFDQQNNPGAGGGTNTPAMATSPSRPTAAGALPADVIIHKLSWKSGRMDAYVTALLRAALKLREGGINYFNNDDVPAEFQPLDKTTVGTAFGLLLKEGIVKPYRGSIAAKKIWGGVRASTRENCNGHRNQLYAVQATLARTWLERHGAAAASPVQQLDLFAAGPVTSPGVCVGG